jgi:hypothetical protein
VRLRPPMAADLNRRGYLQKRRGHNAQPWWTILNRSTD